MRGLPRSLPVHLFSPHSLPDNAGHDAPAVAFQNGLSVDTPEQIQQRCDETRPACLMTGTEPRTVVAVEILVEQDQVTPMRVVLELGRSAVDGATSIRITQK